MDAKGQALGRLASRVSYLLTGKHKPTYHPTQVCSDFVVIINSDKLDISEKKKDFKLYRHHTGYPGGLKTVTLRTLFEKDSPQVPLICSCPLFVNRVAYYWK